MGSGKENIYGSLEQSKLTEQERETLYTVLQYVGSMVQVAADTSVRPDLLEDGPVITLNVLTIGNSILFTSNISEEGVVLFLEEMAKYIRPSVEARQPGVSMQ